MNWTIFAVLLLANTDIAIVMAFLLTRRRRARGSQAMALMFMGLAVWTFGYAMIILSHSMSARVDWLKFENIGIVTTPVFWFLFAVYYTRNERWVPRPVQAILFVIPAVTLVLLFSERWFDLYYSAIQGPEVGLGPVRIVRGGWYLVQLLQTYVLLLLGFAILLAQMLPLREFYRRQVAFVLAALLVPVGLNVLYQRGASLWPGLDPEVDLTPISFMLTGVLISVGVIGLRLFDLIPIARSVVVESLPEMVLVVDSYNRILDANQISFSRLGKRPEDVIGHDATEVFAGWPELAKRFLTDYEAREEIQMPGDAPRTYELTISPIYSTPGFGWSVRRSGGTKLRAPRPGMLEGRVILAHDVTERKNVAEELRQTNAALEAEIAAKERLQAQLEEQAMRDPLTGSFNRRYLAEALDGEVARSQREGLPLSVMILDVDHFKQFNDQYGHRCGDVVLMALADMLRHDSRRSDIVCRYGGEEFVIALFNTPLDAAVARAEHWRAMFEGLTVDYDGRQLNCTFSAGVASLHLHGSDGESILQAADQALYRSKAEGRNRVTVYGQPMREISEDAP